MKKIARIGVLLSCCLLAWGGGVQAAPKDIEINYQGVLQENGAPVHQNGVQMVFRLFTSTDGNKFVWSETRSVDVVNGIYAARLGTITSLLPDIFLDYGQLWLEVTVANQVQPRQPFSFVPYAAYAQNADLLDGSHSSVLEESAEIDADINAHGAIADAHHSKTTSFTEMTGIVSDTQIPTSIARDTELDWNRLANIPPGFADGVDDGGTGTESDPQVGSNTLNKVPKWDGAALSSGSIYDENGNVSIGTSTTSGHRLNVLETTSGQAAVRGDHSIGTPTRGFLGAQGEDDFDGIATADWYGKEIGVAGISTGTSDTDNYGVIGHSNNVGVRGEYSGNPTGNYGELGKSGTGVYGSGSDNGVYGYSDNGMGLFGTTNSNPPALANRYNNAGYFYSSKSDGLFSSTVYTRSDNAGGIALWAHNDNAGSTDATIVSSNDNTGSLFKGYGNPVTGGSSEEININNDGSINLLNVNGHPTVVLTPRDSNSANAGKITVHNAVGERTIDLVGGHHGNAGGGKISLWNADEVETIRLDGSAIGGARIITQVLQITGGSDLSENFNVQPEDLLLAKAGMVVSIDPVNPGKLKVSSEAYDNKVAGIISGAGGIKPGMMMGQKGSVADGDLPVALTGRVYCYADASGASIVPGDLLTSSANPGHAMKVTDHQKANGAILGKAMTGLDSGNGLVLVLVSLQ